MSRLGSLGLRSNSHGQRLILCAMDGLHDRVPMPLASPSLGQSLISKGARASDGSLCTGNLLGQTRAQPPWGQHVQPSTQGALPECSMGGGAQMFEIRWVSFPRSDEAQAFHFSSFLWESILKNGLNAIKSVTFMTRKYGMIIKLAEHGNERVLKV